MDQINQISTPETPSSPPPVSLPCFTPKKSNVKIWVGIIAVIAVVSIGAFLMFGKTSIYKGNLSGAEIEEAVQAALKPATDADSLIDKSINLFNEINALTQEATTLLGEGKPSEALSKANEAKNKLTEAKNDIGSAISKLNEAETLAKQPPLNGTNAAVNNIINGVKQKLTTLPSTVKIQQTLDAIISTANQAIAAETQPSPVIEPAEVSPEVQAVLDSAHKNAENSAALAEQKATELEQLAKETPSQEIKNKADQALNIIKTEVNNLKKLLNDFKPGGQEDTVIKASYEKAQTALSNGEKSYETIINALNNALAAQQEKYGPIVQKINDLAAQIETTKKEAEENLNAILAEKAKNETASLEILLTLVEPAEKYLTTAVGLEQKAFAAYQDMSTSMAKLPDDVVTKNNLALVLKNAQELKSKVEETKYKVKSIVDELKKTIIEQQAKKAEQEAVEKNKNQPTLSVSISPANQQIVGQPVTFTLTASDMPEPPLYKFKLEFGDGNIQKGDSPTNQYTKKYTYQTPQINYVVQAQVFNKTDELLAYGESFYTIVAADGGNNNGGSPPPAGGGSGDIKCEAGFLYDTNTKTCVPPSNITCASGLLYDPNSKACVPQNQIIQNVTGGGGGSGSSSSSSSSSSDGGGSTNVTVNIPPLMSPSAPDVKCSDPKFTYDAVAKVCVPPTQVAIADKDKDAKKDTKKTKKKSAKSAADDKKETGAIIAADTGSTPKTIDASPKPAATAYGATIQGKTGPGVLLYPILVAGANGLYYLTRRRRK